MEFPKDVLDVIRAFYQPFFREFRLFNRAKKVLDKQWVDWPKLKEVLQTDLHIFSCV